MASSGERRRARLEAACVYLIVTVGREAEGVLAAAYAALASGAVDLVQLRDVSGDPDRLRERAVQLRSACATHDALFLLNDHPELAAALDADGAHVGQGDMPSATARAWLGSERLLGLSTHDPEEIERAHQAPVDYLGLGPCFATGSKVLERAPGGAALFARCAPAAGALPLFPIGGITPQNVHALVAAGATRAAVGSGILAAEDPAAAARGLRDALRPGPDPGQGR